MKILLIADGRSPITRRWIEMMKPFGYELVLISTYPCNPVEGVIRHYSLPLAFARQSGSQAGVSVSTLKKLLINSFRPLAQQVRHILGPWTIVLRSKQFRSIVEFEKPNLVHALRIPFEGMLASYTPKNIPVILSTWGNDLTLHAPSNRKMSRMTKQALQRADGLLSDTQRDLQLALSWGLETQKPKLVAAGNGGLDLSEIEEVTGGIQKNMPPQIINPRGMRTYVRNDTFFRSIPLVLSKKPDVQFVCTSMAGQSEAEHWVSSLGIEKNVTLLPLLSQHELWCEFAKSQITLSVSEHDGTPNSLLEAMAVGCFPICGDIESIQEWITPHQNGLLVNPSDPVALAESILLALDHFELQEQAKKWNLMLVKDRASLEFTRINMREFYEQFI